MPDFSTGNNTFFSQLYYTSGNNSAGKTASLKWLQLNTHSTQARATLVKIEQSN